MELGNSNRRVSNVLWYVDVRYSLSREEESYKLKLSGWLVDYLFVRRSRNIESQLLHERFLSGFEHREHESVVHRVIGTLQGAM